MRTILIERPLTPRESLKESCRQMNLIREGKLTKETWSNFIKELEEEKEEDYH